MKGQVGVLLVAVAATLIIGGILLNVFAISSNEILIAAKEKQVLIGIDRLEAIKQGIPYMLAYSFNQSLYEITSTNECKDLTKCLDKLEERMKEIVNEYANAVEELPEYSHINITLLYSDGKLYKAKIVAESSGLLCYKGEDFTIYDNPNVTQELELSLFEQ